MSAAKRGKPSAAGASGSAQEARAGMRVPFRCWRTLHPTVDCRLHRFWAASCGRGSATAPSCVGYACTPQHRSSPFIACAAHHSDHFRAVPCSSCGLRDILPVPADSAGWGLPPQGTGTGYSKLRYRIGWHRLRGCWRVSCKVHTGCEGD